MRFSQILKLVVLLLVLATGFSISGGPQVWCTVVVCSSYDVAQKYGFSRCDYSDVQEAINKAKEGDGVCVLENYVGNLRISKDLGLFGMGYNNTAIQGNVSADLYAPVITIYNAAVDIAGFEIRGSFTYIEKEGGYKEYWPQLGGIAISGEDAEAYIFENRIRGVSYFRKSAIRVVEGAKATIKSNIIENAYYGVEALGGGLAQLDNTRAERNIFKNIRKQICFGNCIWGDF